MKKIIMIVTYFFLLTTLLGGDLEYHALSTSDTLKETHVSSLTPISIEKLRTSYSTTVPNVSIRKYFSPWLESYYTNELSVKEILPYSIQSFAPEATITLVLEHVKTTSELRLNFIKGEKKQLNVDEFISSKVVEYGKDNKTVYLFVFDAKRIHEKLPSQEVQLAFTIEELEKDIRTSIAVWNAYTSVLHTEKGSVNIFIFDNMVQTTIKYEVFEKETNELSEVYRVGEPMLIQSNTGYVIDSLGFQQNKLFYSRLFQKQWIGYKTGYNLDVPMQKALDSLLAKYYDSNSTNNTLLYFWGDWCSPCLKTMPKLLPILKSQSHANVIFFSFSFKESLLPRVASTMIKYDIQHPNVALHPDASLYYFIRDLHIEIYPTYILIDQEGKIVFRGNEINDDLLKLLE